MLSKGRNVAILFGLILLACQTEEEIKTEDAPDIKTESFEKEESSLEEDVKAYKTVLNIVKETGLDQNFMIVPSDIPYAKAYLDDNGRYLAYNPDFIDLVFNTEDSTKNWVAVGKVSHEIGHHLSKHELTDGQASPAEVLQADKYSGYVFYKLGAPMDTAVSAMEQVIAMEPTKDNLPPADARINAMSAGYNDALTLDQSVDTLMEESLIAIANSDETVTDPVVPLDTPAAEMPKPTETEEEKDVYDGFTFKCVLVEDSTVFYIDENDQITTFANEKFLVVGYKTNSKKPGFEWTFEANDLKYGVDAKGRMWARGSEGKFVVIGQVYKM